MKTTPHNVSVYERNGYKDRGDYLDSLADDRGIDPTEVAIIADVLGDGEDFDGLISTLEDYEDLLG